ncbi:MAG: chromosomal replication initiator protein DnaA [Firmicutes bacterium]|nr:chromosomal replication initiator protein DnaA [Bacillota bacterium]
MSQHLTDIWNEALSLIETGLSKASFHDWLAGSRPLRLDNGTLVVLLPNQFARDWVEARYSTALKHMVRALVGQEWEILFIAPGEEAAAPKDHMPSLPPSPVQPANGEVYSGVLNPKYTFDTFVVGNGNRFAHAACLAVAEAPAQAYNPLFIYGGVGLGKTHLMQAVGHYALEQNPGLKVVYASSETFTNDLINAIGRKSMAEFRSKYRNIGVLLIDDIQFVAGKESTQEEFFHTFNALHEANKQIVITSDRPPKDIPTLEERLRSRFEWGLTTDIQAPDLETRIAILRRKSGVEHLNVPDEVLAYIANSVQSNIRELEGALNRVVAYSLLTNRDIDLDLATHALSALLNNQTLKPISTELIQRVVTDHFGLDPGDMKGRNRSRNVAFARQVAMFLSRHLIGGSFPAIGTDFGGRDHTTILHGCAKLEAEMEKDPRLAATIRELIEKIKNS